MSAGWADERHAVYIRSLEDSLVHDQLYKHLGSLTNAVEQGPSSPSPKNYQFHNHRHGAKKKDSGRNEFKVFQGGVWRKAEFQRRSNACAQVQPQQCLPKSPWIQHFIPSGYSISAAVQQQYSSSAASSLGDRESGIRTIPGGTPLSHGRKLGARMGGYHLDENAGN